MIHHQDQIFLKHFFLFTLTWYEMIQFLQCRYYRLKLAAIFQIFGPPELWS